MREVRPMTEVEVKLFKEVERLRAGDADRAKTWLAKTAKIERLLEANEQLENQADSAICEIERLRELLREALPALLGERWQEDRYCPRCWHYDGHADGCLITRIEAALAAGGRP
jgi:hypothetical protein